jgi:spore maturation protein A
MCLWGGIMRIAEKGGLTTVLARGLAPLMRLLFPGLDPDGPACRSILMNMAANMLGLGNAATPLGLKAMEELDKANPHPGIASNHMVTFVVLNTASIQLIPTTVAALRLQYGAASPLNILPAVWVTSLASAVVAVILSKILGSRETHLERDKPPIRLKTKRGSA